MSGRLVRRILNQKQLEVDNINEEHHQSDADSSSPTAAPSKNPFLLLNDDDDDQEDEPETVDDATHVLEPEHPAVKKPSDVAATANRKSKKKKKKNKDEPKPAKLKPEKPLDSVLEDLSISVTPSNGGRIKQIGSSSVLAVDPKYLKAENELRKIFGSKVVSSFENSHSGASSRQIHGGRRLGINPRKTILVSPLNTWPRWDGSMSMELLKTKDGVHYFRYVYSSAYNIAQQVFEAAKATNDLNLIGSLLVDHPFHVESLLTFAELFKFSGEHQKAADAISQCLFGLECAWHPLFNPMQGNFQLKYTYDINKPLFTALFSHMKNMDRRGCHRSALEVCKFLLSLDSDDPKGALFCIDYFALRAQEYGWLERFAEEYGSDCSLWLFPNFAYSLAVCRFYLEREGNVPTEKASSTALMKQALMLHPSVLQKLVAKAPLKDSAWNHILKQSLFVSAKSGSSTLDHLIDIYVERSYLIWRFPELHNLLKEAALLVLETVKENSSEVRDWACVRKETFSSGINGYSHLLVSDFTDTIPSIPPEELQQLMGGGPQARQGGDVAPDRAQAPQPPREVAGRNVAAVLLESVLPWINYRADDDRGEG